MKKEEIYEITDALEKVAGEKLRNAQSYYEGYIQACEDFSKHICQKLIEEANSN